MRFAAFIVSLIPALSFAADQPVARWSFDDTNNTGPSAKLIRTTTRPGVFGLAAGFGAKSNGRIEIDLGPLQQRGIEAVLNDSFTLEMWIIDTAAAPDNRRNYSLFYKADRHAFTRNSIWLYRARGDGNYYFRIRNSLDDGLMLTIPNPAGARSAGDGAWHHLAVTVERTDSGRTGVAYVDGKEVARATTQESGRLFRNDGKVLFGSNHHGDSSWQGALDEPAIYDRVLSASTIAVHHAAGRRSLAPPPPPEPKISREEHFELHVRPLLADKCAGCHSGKPGAKDELYVMSRKALVRGGDYGPAIIPGDSEESLLILAVKRIHKELRMPPDEDDRLSPREIAHLQRWVKDGAYWPAEPDDPMLAKVSQTREIKSDHWSFQPRQEPSVPKLGAVEGSRTEIDRFLARAQAEAGVNAVGLADRRTLIRRATFDLIGLPPTKGEVDAFLVDPATDVRAFGKVVERLLASRHYGERWGRHWLDVARYADTQGDVGDYPIPSAYKYRNWVIKALNADMPYDEFLQRQIAGDLMAETEANEQTAHDSIIATGFIALSRRFGNTKTDDMHLTIEDTLDTLGRGVLGLTLRCARCHDHKFDPVLNTDYYGLYGVFEGTRYPWMGASDAKSPSDLSPGKVGKVHRQKTDEYFRLITRYEYQMNNHFRPWLKPTLAAYRNVTRQMENGGDREKLKAEREKHLNFRGGKFRELMLHGLDWIKKEKARLGSNPVYDFVFAVSDRQPVDSHVHLRGNPKVTGELAPRRAPLFLGGESFANNSASGRLELANWLTNDDHPLTPRVIVNRVWAWHFGRGLVPTVDDFGTQGQPPSHPKLLDWLANRFVADGWSLKQLHRRIMLSRAYRLSSETTEANLASDPDNQWLWHFRRRRLEAEAIRDAMLFVADRLDLQPGGSHPFRPWHARRYSLNGPFNENFDHMKRSVYLMTQRLFKHPFLGLFDGPDTNSSMPARKSSSNPGQALYLMNAEPIRDISLVFADRALERNGGDTDKIQWIWQRAYSRPASIEEHQLALAHITRFMATAKNKGHLQREAWASLCRAVLTSNEFFHLD